MRHIFAAGVTLVIVCVTLVKQKENPLVIVCVVLLQQPFSHSLCSNGTGVAFSRSMCHDVGTEGVAFSCSICHVVRTEGFGSF